MARQQRSQVDDRFLLIACPGALFTESRLEALDIALHHAPGLGAPAPDAAIGPEPRWIVERAGLDREMRGPAAGRDVELAAAGRAEGVADDIAAVGRDVVTAGLAGQ